MPKNISWATIQAELPIAKYRPLVFPLVESRENIFKSSSKEKTTRVFRAKPRVKKKTALRAFFEKANSTMDKASRAMTAMRNARPPIFLNIRGAVSKAKIENIDPSAYTIPTNFSFTKEERKLEFM